MQNIDNRLPQLIRLDEILPESENAYKLRVARERAVDGLEPYVSPTSRQLHDESVDILAGHLPAVVPMELPDGTRLLQLTFSDGTMRFFTGQRGDLEEV